MQHAEKAVKPAVDTPQRQAAPEHSAGSASIDDSPRMVAQRQQLRGLFGDAAQSQATRFQPSVVSHPRVEGPRLAAAGSTQVAQLARIVKRPTEDVDAPQEYVVVDVPGDGTCLIHSFNLTNINQGILGAFGGRPPGQVTAQMVEDAALKMFRAMSGEPTVGAAFQASGLASRYRIATRWRNNLPDHEPGLQGDIQTILHMFLEPQGLLGRKDEGALPSSPQSVSDKPQSPPVTDDFDFVFDAVYFPNRARQENHSSSHSASSLDRAMFAITDGELRALDIPMGVASGGELAAKICNYVVALAEPYIVGRFLPMHALVLPPPNNIPLALVRAYIDEFAVNTELWASQTALTTLSAMEDTKVELHTFDEDDEHVNSDDNFPGTKGHVDLYQGGAQTHFQAMFGPFAAGFLKDGGIVQADWDMGEREGEGKSDSVSSASKLDFSASSLGRSDRDDAPRSGLASLFHDFGSYLHPEATASLTAQDRSWIESVVDELGWDFHQPADVVGVVYRAAAMLGRPDVFSLSPADAAKLVTAHERARDEKASGGATSSSHESQRRDPIIPLAGLVPELVECGIPLEEIGRLLPHANAYLAFHAQRSSWKAKDAGPRVQALKALAAILNQWAETYKQPQLRRGPSIAEHTTVPSPLAKGDVIGVNMRALLTIDPGDLVGFEPEESQTWVTFRDALQGFVRAHVLNKHVGGSGLPRNIGYLSGEDNTRMSKLGEEYVKKEVIENGKQIFFGVEMPMGRPDLTQSPHFLSPKIAGMLVNQVSMRVGEVMPFENEEGEKDVEFRNVFLRDELGVTDDDVAQSNSGALTFATETPNVDSLSRINVNHTKRIRTEVGKSTDMSLDAFALPVWARQVVAQAQRDLLKSPSLQERKAILGQVQEQLTGKVPDKDVAAQLSKLAEVGRQAATLANTQEKKEASGARHLMNPARSEFLAKHTLSETQQQQVAAMTDTNFQRVQTLLANGAKLHEAVNLNNLREPSYSRLLAALQQAKKKGGGIGSFFA